MPYGPDKTYNFRPEETHEELKKRFVLLIKDKFQGLRIQRELCK